MRGKPLVLKQLENGCIIPTSHKLNANVKRKLRNIGARRIALGLPWLL